MPGLGRPDLRDMLSALSASFSSTFQANTQSQIGIAVARKTLDAAEAEGQAVLQMIESAAEVGDSARRQGVRVSPSGGSGAGRGAISARPGPGETGGRLDLRA